MKNLLKQTTFLAIVASLLWSSAFVGIKIGLKYHTPLQFAGVRFFLAGLLLLLVIGNPQRFLTEVRNNFLFVCMVAFLQVVLQYTFFYMGVKLVPASISAMIVGASPLFVALIAHFSIKSDRFTVIKSLSILLGISGVAVIALCRKNLPSGAEISLLGVLYLILNNVSSGISNVVIAKKRNSVSPLVLTSSSLIIGGLAMIVISLPVEGLIHKAFPPEYFIALAWLSFLSATAVTIWNTLLQRTEVKVSELNIWKFLIPVSGAILSWLILPNESPDLISVLGMCLIGASLVVLNIPNRKTSV
jgi:Permeases of the drug/metabolite transporter (DMT) superfamily